MDKNRKKLSKADESFYQQYSEINVIKAPHEDSPAVLIQHKMSFDE